MGKNEKSSAKSKIAAELSATTAGLSAELSPTAAELSSEFSEVAAGACARLCARVREYADARRRARAPNPHVQASGVSKRGQGPRPGAVHHSGARMHTSRLR